MYGVVTKYVLKPKHSLTRVSSAPHIISRASSRIDASRPPAPDQTYGATTLGERGSSHGAVIPVESRLPAGQQLDLRRTRSELATSKATVFAYHKPGDKAGQQRAAGDDGRDEEKWEVGPDESTPMLGFLSTEPSHDFLPIVLTCVACLGSLCFGFHIGFSSPFEDAVLRTSRLSQQQLDLMFSLISLGAVVGALSSGPFSASFGRRTAIVCSALPYIVGSLLMVWAEHDLVFLCLGRLLVGIGVGSSSVLVPLYVAEIAPPARRGSLGTASSFFMAGGLVLVNAAGISAVRQPDAWKVVLMAALIPVAVMALMMQFYGCETPRFLMSVQRNDDARRALRRLRGPQWDVEGEINEMMDTDEVGLGSVAHSKEALRAWKEQYMKYFQPEAEDEVDYAEVQHDIGYGQQGAAAVLTDDDDTDEDDSVQRVHIKSEEVPPTSAQPMATSASATSLSTVGTSPTLKSSLKPQRSSSANSAPQITSPRAASDLPAVGSFTLPEAPRDKKSVRVTLPGHADPEPLSSSSGGSSSRSPSPPPSSSSADRQAQQDEKPKLIMRARSIARRAFPSHTVLPSASSSASGDSVDKTSWMIYLQRSHFVPLLLGVSLQCLQQWSGINAFMFHLKAVLQDKNPEAAAGTAKAEQHVAEESALVALYGATAVAGLQMLMVGFAMVLMEKAGRRVWLLLSSLGMSASALLLAYSSYSGAPNNINILLVMAYIASFAIGMGPMPWLVCSEIFPSAIRSSAVSIATTANWLNAFAVTVSYPALAAWLGESGVYLLYSCIIAVGMMYVFLCLPETAGKSLDEIEELFSKDKATGRQ